MVCPDCEKLAQRVAELEKLVIVLQKRLLAYENANTPPSKSRRERRSREPTGNPRGAPVGHEGTTRKTPEPDKTVDVAPLDRCRKCNAPLGKPDGFLDRLISELLLNPQLLVTLYRLPVHTCKKCGTENVASHPDCPDKGLFGHNVMALVAMLKHKARLPYGKISSVLKNIFRLELTPTTALELDSRATSKLSPEYEKLVENMRNSDHSYTDETSANVNGERYNTWIFTNEDTTLLATRKSRGKKVLEEILGNYLGCIICDGHRAYSNFTSFIQRCWAHMLREAKHFAEDLPEALPLYNELKELYEWGVERYRKRLTKKQRYSMWVYARQRLRKILACYAHNKPLQKFLEKIRNGFNHWFTFILHPEIEPTNNRGERGIRETVVQRKIYGCLRNEKGTYNHDVMSSLIATWEQRGLNPYTQILTSLRG